MEDRPAMIEFIRKHSFGLMFSTHEGGPWATHMPFIFEESADGSDMLLGHMARANPQWKDIDAQRVLVVFQGPHAYISPSWYFEKNQVPTWNYMAVHATGITTVLNEQQTGEVVGRMLKFYQTDAAMTGLLGDVPFKGMLRATVGIRVAVERLEGAAKLNQNKSAESRKNVAERLLRSDDAVARQLGSAMTAEIARRVSEQ